MINRSTLQVRACTLSASQHSVIHSLFNLLLLLYDRSMLARLVLPTFVALVAGMPVPDPFPVASRVRREPQQGTPTHTGDVHVTNSVNVVVNHTYATTVNTTMAMTLNHSNTSTSTNDENGSSPGTSSITIFLPIIAGVVIVFLLLYFVCPPLPY